MFSGFVTIVRYRKWLSDINLLLGLIHQMAALVRRALEEVCTVPVLLVVGNGFVAVAQLKTYTTHRLHFTVLS